LGKKKGGHGLCQFWRSFKGRPPEATEKMGTGGAHRRKRKGVMKGGAENLVFGRGLLGNKKKILPGR